MHQRIIEPEILDSLSTDEAAGNLRDLVRLNRWTLAHRRLVQLLRKRFQPAASFRFLDVGGASGDMGAAVRDAFPNAKIFCLDLNFDHLQVSQSVVVQANAFCLPFPGRCFEVVHCSLFLHHFDTAGTMALIVEMHRVAASLVLIQDLHRHWLSYYFLPATKFLFRWHWATVSDGKKSVAAGWRRGELESILKSVDLLPHSKLSWHFPSFRYFIAISTDY